MPTYASLPVRFCLSSSICPVCLSSSAYPHCLSCSACPILPFSFLPVPSAGPVQPDLLCLSVLPVCSSYPVPFCCLTLSVLFFLSVSASPVLLVLSWNTYMYITHERYRKLGARNTEKAKAQKMKSGGSTKAQKKKN